MPGADLLTDYAQPPLTGGDTHTTKKSPAAYRTISEAADALDVPQHVLRFWESKFPQLQPLKRAGNRRFYRPEDMALLRQIHDLLYGQGYTIKGAVKFLRSQRRDKTAAAKPSVTVMLPTDPARPASKPAMLAGDMVAVPRAELKRLLFELQALRLLMK